jgi:hypothetical protein
MRVDNCGLFDYSQSPPKNASGSTASPIPNGGKTADYGHNPLKSYLKPMQTR